METEKINNNSHIQSTYPLAPPYTYIRSDEESIVAQQQRRRKRRNRLTLIAAISIFLTIVILVFALVLMRFKTPAFRLREATFSNFQVGNNTNPSLNLVMNARFTIRNRNYGWYKYETTTIVFAYKGLTVGQEFMEDSRVRAQTTKKVNAIVQLSSVGLFGSQNEGVFNQLGRDIEAGVVKLTCHSELIGKVQLLRIIKRRKNARLSCTMDVDISMKSIRNLICQ